MSGTDSTSENKPTAEKPTTMLFGAPVAASAPAAAAFDASAVRPFGAPETAGGAKGENEDGEDYSANFKPLVDNLTKVEAKELADDEEKIFTKRSKVYRFFKETSEWKERCVGDLNLIKNTKTGRVRVEMRMEKTQRVQINHSLRAETKLTAGMNSARMHVWMAYGDTSFSENHEPENVTVAARFLDDESATAFKKIFEAAVEAQKEIEAKEEAEKEGESDADSANSDDDADAEADKTESKPAEAEADKKTEKKEEKDEKEAEKKA